MNRTKKFLGLIVVLLLICMLTVSFAACHKMKNDPETRPLVMSIQTPDGVYNPFFSTSAYDSSIVSLTQIGMMSTDKNGNLVCGYNEPTVALDYSVQELNAQQQPKSGSEKTSFTKYEFVIKNGVKFSDGTPLTILDVLFNLYVYLDPAYTGSATIYSTDIVGLRDYRLQQTNASEDDEAGQDEIYLGDAMLRISDLGKFVGHFSDQWSATEARPTTDKINAFDASHPDKADPSFAQEFDSYFADELKDILTIAKEFRKELETDWNSIDINEDLVKRGFDHKWQMFAIQDAGFTEMFKSNQDGTPYRDADTNQVLDRAMNSDGSYNAHGALAGEAATNATLMETAIAQAPYNTYSREEAIKQYWIDIAFGGYFGNINIDAQSITNGLNIIKSLSADNVTEVLNYWATGTKILEQFIAEERSDAVGDRDSLEVPNIKGITFRKASEFNGKNLGAEHDILTILINDVDPKAIFNFSFNVAPMHYYSSSNYNGTNYVQAMKDDWNNNDGKLTHFGLSFNDFDFMQNVINANVGVPLGAGPYMAANGNTDQPAQKASDFDDKNVIYYTRNPYFNTLGGGREGGIQNAKIKMVRYQVVNSEGIVDALSLGEIDYGDPSATQDNINELNRNGIAHVETDTLGYGYVGINPNFVPDIEVRRIIMRAMNTDLVINNYYKGELAQHIYRPMSRISWAYPTDSRLNNIQAMDESTLDYSYFTNTQRGDDNDYIESLLRDAGYSDDDNDGVYSRIIDGKEHKLEYEFTIAGGSNDHPAYAMFLNAQQILNKHGFNIEVKNSLTALSDLNTGKLEVWAAAWSSTIDPDMYQVYHKDSKATSTNNWGYKVMRANATNPESVYYAQWQIVLDLSEIIDQARETTVQSTRANLYAKALNRVMELAVEFPTYQRQDLAAYNPDLLDPETMPSRSKGNLTSYNGLLSRIWEVSYL